MLKGDKKKEYQREYMKVKRSNKQGSNSDGSNIEMVPASYVQGVTGKFKSLPERERYLTLSDNQVFDRLNQPTPNISDDLGMQFCNESKYNLKPRKKR